MENKVRLVSLDDISKISSLEKRCLLHPWEEEELIKLVKMPSKDAFCYEEEGKILGYMGFSFLLDEAEVGNICVDSEYRRRGIASILINEAISYLADKEVERLFLEVDSDNGGAISLYEKLGFEPIGRRNNYYGLGKDAILYSRDVWKQIC